jgi:hypothetical protein
VTLKMETAYTSWPITTLCNIPQVEVTSVTNHRENLAYSVLVLSLHILFRASNIFLTNTLYLQNVYPISGACPVYCTSFTLQYYLHDCINYKVSCYVTSSSISAINPLTLALNNFLSAVCQTAEIHVRFEVSTAVTMKNAVSGMWRRVALV